MNDITPVQKLEKQLFLLKQEYTNLQESYTDLERKYKNIITTTGSASAPLDSYLSRLALTVSSIYGRSVYSDLKIRLQSKTISAHKLVIHARSDILRGEMLSNANELDWSDLDEDIGTALLKWIYTDVVDLHHDHITLGLLRAAHRFQIPGLLNICERALIASVTIASCIPFYCVAEEVGARNLLEYCLKMISNHWDELTPQDFEHMSGRLLYKMLKNKTKHVLHYAVELLREDVVLLCLEGKDYKVSEMVNTFSENGQLPLQMALTKKNQKIAEILLENGSANIDAYDGTGSTILIDALKRKDEYTVTFLLEKNCQLDLVTRTTGDTALHIICSWDSKSTINIAELGKKILSKSPNVNVQNMKGETPLHLAITTINLPMINLLLDVPNIHLDVKTLEETSALEMILKKNSTICGTYLEIAEKLIRLGVCVNPIKSKTQDSLLQILAREGFEDSAIFLADYGNLNHCNNSGLTALHIAAENNLPHLAAKLLNTGASPNLQSNLSQLKLALHVAVESNSLDVIREFVNYRLELLSGAKKSILEPNFNTKNASGDSPLSLCLLLKNTELAQILIEGGANVNERNGQDMTLLHQAISNHDTKTAIFLLEHGADMNALTGTQDTALQLAVDCNLSEVVDALCTQGVALSAADNKGDPPLWTALEMDYIDVAHVLVRHGVDTDCWGPGPDGCLQTLLHRAIDENKETIAIFLIRSQCDIDSPRQPGANGKDADEARGKASPLHLCCQWGLTKVLKTLINHGANVNALDAANKTPLHLALENQHEEIISILLCHPSIDLKIRDNLGNAPFSTSLRKRNHKAAQRILDQLPNAAEQMDKRGRNFLHLAIMKEDLESVLFLLAIQVDVNSRVHDASQSTPLHLAAAAQNEMITRNLILAGARINEKDATEKTPLHIASERGNIAAVSALIQNNADFDALDGDGNNALHIAVRNAHLSIIRELLTESRINAEAKNFKSRNPLHELCRTGEDSSAAAICELFIECMPTYPINEPDMDGNTPLLLAFMRGQAPLCKVLVKNGACLGTENRAGVSIFNFKLATNQLLYKLLDQLTQESPWAESDHCQECGTKFTLTMRKHHCRHCGRVLCSKCSNNDVPILKFGINKPVRVCCFCFEVLHGANNTLQ